MSTVDEPGAVCRARVETGSGAGLHDVNYMALIVCQLSGIDYRKCE